MRAFLCLTSLMALVLGFLGAALGLRPRPVQADAPGYADRLAAIEIRLDVLCDALADVERRFEEHRARTPAREIADRPTDDAPPAAPPVALDVGDSGPEVPLPIAPPASGPRAPSLLTAALERADEHLAAGDAAGAREIYREVLGHDGVPAAMAARARLGVAETWAIIGNREGVRHELESLLSSLGDGESDLRTAVRARLARLDAPK